MNKKGFISISVVYTLFMLFIMLLLAVLAGYANMRVLLRIAKGDTSDILVDREDNRQVGVVCRQQNMAECFAQYSNLDHDLNYHDGDEIDSGSTNEAGDNSYRYSGNNPFNYVCFGTSEEICPEDNLYRIIGIFDGQAKLIKVKPIASNMAWNSKTGITSPTFWQESSLSDYLNSTFLNSIPSEWQQRIAKATWDIGEGEYDKLLQSNAKSAYDYEVGEHKVDLTTEAKIGLMYLNDFYYAASPEYWGKKGLDISSDDYRLAAVSNWLAGYNEWMITPVKNEQKQAYKVFKAGYAGADYVTNSANYDIRPVFYLYSTVSLVSGIGTLDDPFLVN